MSGLLARLKLDPYIVALLLMVALASFAPARDGIADGLGVAAKAGVALVFFLHGARLSPDAVRAGMTHWRLHLLVLACTFGLFPLLGLIVTALPVTPVALAPGIVLLCCLPSTVQSSVGFTAIARGNVAAAVAAAAASNLIGIVLTPVLAGLLLHSAGGAFSIAALWMIVLQLLAPFIVGQFSRRWISPWLQTQARILGWVDKSAILLVVYVAFSEAVAGGLWRKVGVPDLVTLLAICTTLLAVVLAATTWLARSLGFAKADEIAVVFCGSKKSLASGVPMASVLFPAAVVGPMVLPLMIFHQIQLMACAVIAQRYATRQD